jgi:phosphoglycerate dehydrogenase-like enzyme
MKLCVYHPRFATTIADALRTAHPDCVVQSCSDVTRDPPGGEDIQVLIANRFPAGLLGRLPRLRWLQLTGVGTDHLPAGAPRPDLIVTHAGEIPAVAVAEFVWMALLGLAKDAHTLFRQQQQRVWRLPQARRLHGSTLVVIGLGRIGREVARRAAAFGVRVLGVSRSGAPSPLAERVVTADALAEVLPQADHLVVALPATPATQGLLSRALLGCLPAHAVLISVGRAEVLDLAAVVDALAKERLRGALLDVHHAEPLLPTDPLWQVERLWITPHCAYEYPEQVLDLAQLCLDNFTRYLSGQPLRNRTGG